MFNLEFILVTSACAICIGAGILLMRLAARLKRKFPSCPGCGYNLVAVVGRSKVCPECGSSIARGRFLKYGHLPRCSRVMYGVGQFILVFGIVGVTMFIVAFVTFGLLAGKIMIVSNPVMD